MGKEAIGGHNRTGVGGWCKRPWALNTVRNSRWCMLVELVLIPKCCLVVAVVVLIMLLLWRLLMALVVIAEVTRMGVFIQFLFSKIQEEILCTGTAVHTKISTVVVVVGCKSPI